jgi:hypothetical protein
MPAGSIVEECFPRLILIFIQTNDMQQFSNVMGYSGRYFTEKGFLGTGSSMSTDTVYNVIVDGHPRLSHILLVRNSKKGWQQEEFDEEDLPFISALQREIEGREGIV